MIAKYVWIFCLLFAQARADTAPTYRISRPIIHQASAEQTLLAVPLDSAAYTAGSADFRDLRLIDQNGVETPYLLQQIASRKTVIRRLPTRSETLSLQKTGDDGIVITVKLDKDAASADGLTLDTTQHDFEYTLQIQGSNDGQNWQALVDNALIYDYSRYMTIGNRDVALPANSYRQFKIVVAKASQTHAAQLLELTRTLRGGEELQRNETTDLHTEPLHIERIGLWHNHAETLAADPQQFEYPVSSFKISQDTESKTSQVDIVTLRQPLTGFVLQINTTNFSRRAEVQIPLQQGLETRMQTVGSTTLEALHFRDINRDQTGIDFPEQRQERYRIVIHNQDNPPLHINTVIGTGHGYQLLFLPQAGLSYQLLYGTDQAEPPRYDTAPIQELLRRGYQSSAGELGPETGITPVEETWNFGKLLNSRLFLGSAIVLMVIVLGWSLYKVGKRIENLIDE